MAVADGAMNESAARYNFPSQRCKTSRVRSINKPTTLGTQPSLPWGPTLVKRRNTGTAHQWAAPRAMSMDIILEGFQGPFLCMGRRHLAIRSAGGPAISALTFCSRRRQQARTPPPSRARFHTVPPVMELARKLLRLLQAWCQHECAGERLLADSYVSEPAMGADPFLESTAIDSQAFYAMQHRETGQQPAEPHQSQRTTGLRFRNNAMHCFRASGDRRCSYVRYRFPCWNLHSLGHTISTSATSAQSHRHTQTKGLAARGVRRSVHLGTPSHPRNPVVWHLAD